MSLSIIARYDDGEALVEWDIEDFKRAAMPFFDDEEQADSVFEAIIREIRRELGRK